VAFVRVGKSSAARSTLQKCSVSTQQIRNALQRFFNAAGDTKAGMKWRSQWR
jgi:hypothetical protein